MIATDEVVPSHNKQPSLLSGIGNDIDDEGALQFCQITFVIV